VSTPTKTITIKKGDTLTAIAKANHTTVAALTSLNGIKNPNLIIAGASLKVPVAATKPATPAAKPPATTPAKPATKPWYVTTPPLWGTAEYLRMLYERDGIIPSWGKRNSNGSFTVLNVPALPEGFDKYGNAPPGYGTPGYTGPGSDAANNTPPGGSGGSAGGSTPTPSQTQADVDKLNAQHDAITILTNLFTSYGLGTLVPALTSYIQQGIGTDAVTVLLQQTPEYKQRFAANDKRLQAGLGALSPAEYIATERSYRSVMAAAGLPTGFFDNQSDFTNLIANDVSPTELQNRVTTATDAINKAPAATLNYFRQWYSTGDIVAYVLDPTRAQPAIEKNIRAAEAAGLAKGQGFSLGQSDAEHIGGKGLSLDQMSSALGFVGGELPTVNKLDQIYGGNVSQQDVLSEIFDNDAQAAKKRQALASQERAAFSGSSGTSGVTFSHETQV
jgi:murein DD-endopeptidase MepM/ murein hydrolase activator NlpD